MELIQFCEKINLVKIFLTLSDKNKTAGKSRQSVISLVL